MEILIIRDPITRAALREMAPAQFGDFVKAVVDVERGTLALGGELHADGETLLLEDGSKQEQLWGINLYPDGDELVEFDSMINIRPSQGNRSRGVQDAGVRERILEIARRLIPS